MGLKEAGRRMAAAVLLLALLAWAPAWGRTVLELDSARQPIELGDWGDAWIDDSGAAPVERVATDSGIAWQPTRQGAHYRLATGKALWVRFTIPPAPDAERWYLEIPYPGVDKVTLYTPDTAGGWTSQSAGDTLPVADWPVPHRHPLLPVNVSAEEPRNYLLRVENPYDFSAPLSFVSDSRLGRHEQRTSLLLGIYFGLAGLAAMVGLLSALSLRDSAYGFYALAVALMALAQAALSGMGGLHLWPRWPAWNDLAPLVLAVLAAGAFLWFFAATVSMPQRSRRLDLFLKGLALLSLPIALGIVLAPASPRAGLMIPYVTGALLAGAGGLLWAARRGDRYALWLLAGNLPVMLGCVFPMARLAGLIPVGFWTLHGMQLGIAIQLPVLMVVLNVRSQQRRENRRRIQGLDRIDPATGLINGEVFQERLTRMMSRSKRLKHQSAVLLVDIVNSEQIRRDYGSRSADELPLRVAARLLSAARDIDTVARLSERRFGMLIEGPLSPEEAASEGPRIVARCLMPFKNKPLEWMPQVRVAQTMLPPERADAQQVVDRLMGLLNNVAPDSKRAVFHLTS